jgi:hypothetical protein
MQACRQADHEKQRLFVRFANVVDYYAIEEMVTMSAKEGILHFRLLIDVRDVTFQLFPADVGRFKILLERVATESQLGPTAVHFSNPEANGIVHMLSLVATGMCAVRGFADIEAAERWLGWRE